MAGQRSGDRVAPFLVGPGKSQGAQSGFNAPPKRIHKDITHFSGIVHRLRFSTFSALDAIIEHIGPEHRISRQKLYALTVGHV